ncbi:hypothetical protein EZV62_014936 [Acer yangbiense]|uniref:AP complex mu/sigma subunit domain-containing protein n=1 Tax=Acer yangbiense TaxID=1000413 RepID=A0A5C7HTC7_9ROSI|nr:hypothetical protein EZV62_014936 [Acer yangbiense]
MNFQHLKTDRNRFTGSSLLQDMNFLSPLHPPPQLCLSSPLGGGRMHLPKEGETAIPKMRFQISSPSMENKPWIFKTTVDERDGVLGMSLNLGEEVEEAKSSIGSGNTSGHTNKSGPPSQMSQFWESSVIQFVLLISQQGKVRLTKWYSPYSQRERTKWGDSCMRTQALYASLYFCMCIDQDDNELEVLEIIHHYVEILDRYFGSVSEVDCLDLIFNFHKAYYILDEILIAGELQESSKKTVARLIAAQDSLVETAKEQASLISNIIAQATK